MRPRYTLAGLYLGRRFELSSTDWYIHTSDRSLVIVLDVLIVIKVLRHRQNRTLLLIHHLLLTGVQKNVSS